MLNLRRDYALEIVSLSALLLFSPGAFAQEPAAASQPAAPEAAKAAVEVSASPQAVPEAAKPADEFQYFLDLNEELSKQTVVAASNQEEPLKEAPVPVTLITADMIRSSGARNLEELLTTYVPGFTHVVDQNETIIATRGIYGSSQGKVLVMLDGHRLNSRNYGVIDLGYGIGLDYIKRVEVLRGPGSSLYGNVALTSVINIVTKSGKEANGTHLRMGAGSYGQRTASLVHGMELGKNHELLFWGTTYRADGEHIFIPADKDYSAAPVDGDAIVGGVKYPTAYDLGLKYRFGGLTLLAAIRQSKLIEPFSAGGVTGETYDFKGFRAFRNAGPGLSDQQNHLELKLESSISKSLEVELRGYYDTDELQGNTVANPAKGVQNDVSWQDESKGGIAMLRYSYEAGSLGSGNLTAGAQIDAMRLVDSALLQTLGGELVKIADTKDKMLLAKGAEIIYSGFTQLKHRPIEQIILNLGFRYDSKRRVTGDYVSDLSPRLAVVYAPTKTFDVKASYAQSFMDAPYWYRYNSLPSYRGGASLKPEHMSSFQVTPTVTLLNGKLTNSLNLFYNDLHDFIYRNNKAPSDQPIYQNAGLLKSVGAEEELAFLQEAYKIRANLTYQRATASEKYDARGAQMYNVPNLSGNLLVDFNPLHSMYKNSWFNVTLRYMGSQLSPVDITFLDAAGAPAKQFLEPDRTIQPYVLFNVGARLNDFLVEGLSLDGTIYNALDQKYEAGGSVNHPYPQPGRWFLVSLSYHLPQKI